jgi:hypothetical protein
MSTPETLSNFTLLCNKSCAGLSSDGININVDIFKALILFRYMNNSNTTEAEDRANRRILAYKPKATKVTKGVADAKPIITIKSTDMVNIYIEEDGYDTALTTDKKHNPLTALIAHTAPPTLPQAPRKGRPAAPAPRPTAVVPRRRNNKEPDPNQPVGSHCKNCFDKISCFFYHPTTECTRTTPAPAHSAPAAHIAAAAPVTPDLTQSAAFAAAIASHSAASDAAHAAQVAAIQNQLYDTRSRPSTTTSCSP